MLWIALLGLCVDVTAIETTLVPRRLPLLRASLLLVELELLRCVAASSCTVVSARQGPLAPVFVFGPA